MSSDVAAAVRPRLLGVLGGMGPRATTDFLNKVQDLTRASRDQDHVPVLAYFAPQIPDRASAILEGGRSPLPDMLRAARTLEAAGAQALVVPCNTAHYWLADIQGAVATPVLSMIDAVLHEAAALDLKAPVALLGTRATMQADIYRSRAAAAGLDLLTPSPEDQAQVVRVIAQVKAGRLDQAHHALDGVVRNLSDAGAAICILGCTELPLIRFAPFDGVFLDSTLALARRCVDWAFDA